MSFDLAAIRSRLDDPLAVTTALGLIDGPGSYKRLTRGLMVRCVFHAERSPSCLITSTGDGVFAYCFGCKVAGGVFALIAAVAGLDPRADFRRVAELAAGMAGVEEGADVPRFDPPPRPPEPARLDDTTFDRIAQVIARECPVDAAPDVADYIESRGLYDAAAGELAALPGDPVGLARLRARIIAEVGFESWRLSGLAYADGGGMLFAAHRLVAFWRDPDGLALTIQRRMVRAERPGESVGKYVFASRRSPRYPYGAEHAATLGPAGEVAYVEGFLDALAMRALCAREGRDRLVLGLPGTAGWNPTWTSYAEGRVAIVATDGDAAGEACAARIAADLYARGGADVRRARPEGADDWAALLERRREVAA